MAETDAVRTKPPPSLFGRDRDLALISTALANLSDSGGQVIWIEGESGIGKTSLIRRALELHDSALTLYSGSGAALGEDFPLSTLAACLTITGRSDDAARQQIAGLLRGERYGALMLDPILAAAERIIDLVQTPDPRGPTVLVVDDVQWADEMSIRVLSRLASASPGSTLLILLIAQNGLLGQHSSRLRAQVSASGAHLVTLSPLQPAELTQLAATLLHATPGPDIVDALRDTGGNPLYAVEWLSDLFASGRVQVVDGIASLIRRSERSTSRQLTDNIDRRLRALTRPTVAVLSQAALLDSAFTARELEEAFGTPMLDLADALADAVRADVLIDNAGRMSFRHGLIRWQILGALPLTVRHSMHLAIARQLDDAGSPVRVVAQHLEAADRAADTFLPVWLDRLDLSATMSFSTVAERLIARAIEVTDLDAAQRRRLETTLVRLANWTGRDVTALASRMIASSVDVDEIAMLTVIAARFIGRTDNAAGAAMFGRALALDGMSPLWRTRIKAWHAYGALAQSGDAVQDRLARDAALRDAREAVSDAEQVRDPTTIGLAHMVAARLELPTARPAHYRRALEALGDGPDDNEMRANILLNSFAYRLTAGAVQLDDELNAFIAAADEVGGTRPSAVAKSFLAQSHFYRGSWPVATALAGDIERHSAFGIAGIEQRTAALAASIALMTGRRDKADIFIERVGGQAVESAENIDLLWTLLALVDGDRTAALAAARSWFQWSTDAKATPSLLAPMLIGLSSHAGDVDTARCVIAERRQALLEYGVAGDATQAYCEGLARRDGPDLVAAAQELMSTSLRPMAAFCLVDAAVVLAQQGKIVPARAHLNRAVRLHDELGAETCIRLADAQLRRLGVRRGPRTRSNADTSGPGSLTPAERAVASLLADGLGNPQIADRLVISRRTVESHVSRILTKLGLSTRIEVRAALDPSRNDQFGTPRTSGRGPKHQ